MKNIILKGERLWNKFEKRKVERDVRFWYKSWKIEFEEVSLFFEDKDDLIKFKKNRKNYIQKIVNHGVLYEICFIQWVVRLDFQGKISYFSELSQFYFFWRTKYIGCWMGEF